MPHAGLRKVRARARADLIEHLDLDRYGGTWDVAAEVTVTTLYDSKSNKHMRLFTVITDTTQTSQTRAGRS